MHASAVPWCELAVITRCIATDSLISAAEKCVKYLLNVMCKVASLGLGYVFAKRLWTVVCWRAIWAIDLYKENHRSVSFLVEMLSATIGQLLIHFIYYGPFWNGILIDIKVNLKAKTKLEKSYGDLVV